MSPARRPRSRRPAAPGGRQVPRTARMAELLREIVATELARIDDDRLELVTVTAVDVDAELNRAIVFFDSRRGPDADDEVLAALGVQRVRLQAAIGRQVHARKTPVLQFRPDEVIRSAERIEDILRRSPPRRDDRDGTADGAGGLADDGAGQRGADERARRLDDDGAGKPGADDGARRQDDDGARRPGTDDGARRQDDDGPGGPGTDDGR